MIGCTVLHLLRLRGATPEGVAISQSAMREALSEYIGLDKKVIRTVHAISGRLGSHITALKLANRVDKIMQTSLGSRGRPSYHYKISTLGMEFLTSHENLIEPAKAILAEYNEGGIESRPSSATTTRVNKVPRVTTVSQAAENELAGMPSSATALIEAAGQLVSANTERRKLLRGIQAKIGIALANTDPAEIESLTVDHASESVPGALGQAVELITIENQNMLKMLLRINDQLRHVLNEVPLQGTDHEQ